MKPADENVHNLKSYKHAKEHIKHLSAILYIVRLTITALSFYKVYRSALVLIEELKNEEEILEHNISYQKNIIKQKGKVR